MSNVNSSIGPTTNLNLSLQALYASNHSDSTPAIRTLENLVNILHATSLQLPSTCVGSTNLVNGILAVFHPHAPSNNKETVRDFKNICRRLRIERGLRLLSTPLDAPMIGPPILCRSKSL